MSFVSDFLFGSDDPAEQAAQDVRASTAQARGDILDIFPVSDVNRNLGLSQALRVLEQGLTQQADVFREGNVGAQQTLLAGLPQVQAAILGTPVNLSGLQSQQFTFDPTFSRQDVPAFRSTQNALSQAAPNSSQSLEQLLASLGGQGGSFFDVFGDGGSDPSSLDQPALSTRSDSELSLGLSIAKGLSNVPALGLPSIFSQMAIQSEISRRGGISQGGIGPGSGFGGGEDEAGQVDQGLA